MFGRKKSSILDSVRANPRKKGLQHSASEITIEITLPDDGSTEGSPKIESVKEDEEEVTPSVEESKPAESKPVESPLVYRPLRRSKRSISYQDEQVWTREIMHFYFVTIVQYMKRMHAISVIPNKVH